MTLPLDSIRNVNRHTSPVSPAALDALARELGTTLPPGYRAYLETLGRGAFCGLLWVLDPDGVRAVRAEHVAHRTLELAWPAWRNADASFLPADRARLCPIARSMDGDVVYFHLDEPSILAVFPRHRPEIAVSERFEDALAWFARSGVYWQPAARPWFDSGLERVEHALEVDEARVDDLWELLDERATEIAEDAEVASDRQGAPALVFAPGLDGLIEVFGPRLRITENAGSSALARATRELLLRHDVGVDRFEETRRTTGVGSEG